MKTVRDIFVDVLAMKRRRESLEKIRNYIIDTGHDNGFQEIGEPGAPNVAEFAFANGEVIYFDGADWHHKKARATTH
jgi:hypothetical protein